jgi:hypothetical protein
MVMFTKFLNTKFRIHSDQRCLSVHFTMGEDAKNIAKFRIHPEDNGGMGVNGGTYCTVSQLNICKGRKAFVS